MCRKTILSSLLIVAWVLCLTALADDQSSPQKSSKLDVSTQSDQGAPGARTMRKGMMGGPMKERGMKMMQMHQKMQAEMKAMNAENDKLVTDMNQATGQKKIDAMATLLTRLVEQRRMMDEKMGAMHADMMQSMMKDMGAGTAHEPAATDKQETTHEHSTAGEESRHLQHQH